MSTPLKLENLVKHYSTVKALQGIDLEMIEGEVFGLLGPNGAGKTTLISILTTLEKPTSGRAMVFGRDIADDDPYAKSLIGLVPQEIITYGFFTVVEVLRFQSGYYGYGKNDDHIEFLLDRLNLTEHRNKKFRQLSGGMKRRFLIAKALVHHPKLLLLDEPTAGVDIELRQSLWKFVAELNQKQGLNILLTTHYLEEAEKLCNRVGIIHRGKLLQLGKTADMVAQLTCREITLSLKQAKDFAGHRWLLKGGGKRATFSIPRDVGVPGLLGELNLSLTDIDDISTEEGNLEDAFLRVLGEQNDATTA